MVCGAECELCYVVLQAIRTMCTSWCNVINKNNIINTICIGFCFFDVLIHVLHLFISLTQRGRVTHICISKTYHHCFRYWIVTWLAPSHYLNPCWNIVNLILRNKLQWNLKQNSDNFIQENAFGKLVCIIVAILSVNCCFTSTAAIAWLPQCQWLYDNG